MRLFEFEGKDLLQDAGYKIPHRQALAPLSQLSFSRPGALKAQILTGNRLAKGLIVLARTQEEFTAAQTKMNDSLKGLGFDPETIQILQEDIVPYEKEFYLAFRYDTQSRRPVLLYTAQGGSGIEERNSEENGLQGFVIQDITSPQFQNLDLQITSEWLNKLFAFFLSNDMTLVEINPLVSAGGELLFLDAKTELDDTAAFRHEDWPTKFPPRTLFNRQPTTYEKRAKEVNAMDYRGVAGASYFDFDGTVGILASGGGASTLAMDTLLATSLKPANYTEYSGNPTREKVAALSELVLSKPNLEGLWVVGGHANFTDIYETLMAVMDGIEKANLPAGFPIVVRRGGPNQTQGFQAFKERAAKLNLNVQCFDSSTPIPDTAFILEKAVQEFRNKKI